MKTRQILSEKELPKTHKVELNDSHNSIIFTNKPAKYENVAGVKITELKQTNN